MSDNRSTDTEAEIDRLQKEAGRIADDPLAFLADRDEGPAWLNLHTSIDNSPLSWPLPKRRRCEIKVTRTDALLLAARELP